MSLLQRVSTEIKAAMLAKDSERLNTLRLLKSALGYTQIEKKNENLSDAEVMAVVQKELKKRRDAAEQFRSAGRLELAEKEEKESAILETFLPQPFSAAELEALVKEAITETGATSRKEMGRIIKAAQTKAAGRAEGRAISELAARLLPG